MDADTRSENPRIAKIEIALQIDTGNTIYAEFTDIESVQAFLTTYYRNPQAILSVISPKSSTNKPDQG